MFRGLLESVLKSQIRNALRLGDEYRIVLFISAKSSIYSFFQGLTNKKGNGLVALVPDHICSAVPLAVIASGSALHTYPSGEFMVPRGEILGAMINEHSPDVLVLAPIFGAQGKEYSKLVMEMSTLKHGPVVLLDQAQHMDPFPCELQAVVLSFHRKSIKGLNGGALLLNRSYKECELMPSRPIALGEEYYLALRYLAERKQFAKRKIEGKVKAGFYYEGCEYFPGTLENAKMPLFSMLVAIFEMMRLEHYRDVRKANFKLLSERISKVPGCHIIATENVETASQIGMFVEDDIALSTIAKSLAELNVAVRRPYSRFDDPGSSARPRLYSVENPFHRISVP